MKPSHKLLSSMLLVLCLIAGGGMLSPVQAHPASTKANWVQAAFNRQRTGYNPFETTITPSNVSHLTEAWVRYSGDSSPIENNGMLYFSDSYVSGALYAVNATTGATIWTDANDGNFDGTAPAIANGMVYNVTASGTLVAVNATSGKLIWSAGVGLRGDPLWANGAITLGSTNGKLYSFNAFTGATLWSFTAGSAIYSDAATDSGLVYVDAGGTLYAVNNKTGKLSWRYAVQGSPVIANGLVYIGTSELIALNETTGKLVWVNATIQSAGAVAVTNSDVFVVGNGNLYAVNAISGHLLWTASHSDPGTGLYDSVGFSAPVVANGVVYTGGLNEYNALVIAFNAQTGALLWSANDQPDQDPDSTDAGLTPILVNGMLFFETPDYDTMYAYHL